MHIPSPEFLPYALQLVLLAIALHQCPTPVPGFQEHVRSWFHLSTFWETFAGATYTTTQRSLQYLRDAMAGKAPTWDLPRSEDPAPLLRSFDLRSARVRDVALWMARQPDLRDASAQPVNGFEVLKGDGSGALLRLLNVPKPKPQRLAKLLRSVANVLIVPTGQHKAFRARLLEGPDLPDDALAAHFLDAELVRRLRDDDLEGFLTARLERIEAADRQRYEQVRAQVLDTGT